MHGLCLFRRRKYLGLIEGPAVNNNDVLRSLRYILDYNDAKMARISGLAGGTADQAEMEAMLKHEDEEGFKECGNKELTRFLDGLIIHRRGLSDRTQPEGGRTPSLNNNLILKKLRIAFKLQEQDMIRTFKKADFDISGTELTAFFRKRGHKHYRECGDQLLKRFLKGLSIKE